MHTFATVMTTKYTAVITMMSAVTRQDMQGTSEKSILYDIPNAHLVDYSKNTTFIEHHQNKQHP